MIAGIFQVPRSAMTPLLAGPTTSSASFSRAPRQESVTASLLFLLARVLFALLLFAPLLMASSRYPAAGRRSFELLTRRMDVDVDGAPNAYGPPGSKVLDSLNHAHYRGWQDAEIVGYLTDDDHPNIPVRQGPNDPYPGLYISQTAYTDPSRTKESDVTRYVNAARISYVVLGDEAKARGARLGDFVAVYSRATHRRTFGIVGDSGNPSGDEGSLHLLQSLGYPYRDGRHDAVEEPEIIVRYFPGSNPHRLFFRDQAVLDTAALQEGLSRDFATSPLARTRHPKTH